MSEILFVCDMDGTLIEEEVANSNGEILPSRWTQIMRHLGYEACRREEEAKKKWYAKEYGNPVEFLDEVVQIFYDKELKYDYFEEVIGSYEYFPGVIEVFSELNERENYKTALISGGFKALADRVSKDLGIDYTCAACELEWDSDGNLMGWKSPQKDYGSKVSSLKKIITKCGANVSDCVYLCNGNNDIHIAEYIRRYGGNVFGINPTHGLKEFCNDYIVKPTDKEHFGRVLEFIDKCGIVCNNTRYTLSI